MTQIVTICPDGSVSSLHRKDGFDLRALGQVEIERTSDIKWDSSYQLWHIELISGPRKGTIVTSKDWIGDLPKNFIFDAIDEKLLFKEYDQAVAAEIIFLDNIRKEGIF